MTFPDLASLDITVKVIQGRNLVPMDRHGISRKKTSSDPYVTVLLGGKIRGKTKTATRTLNPRWNASSSIHLGSTDANRLVRLSESSVGRRLELRITDEDRVTSDDPMGVVSIPLSFSDPPSTKWYKVQAGNPSSDHYCQLASGELEVYVSATARKVLSVERGNTIPIASNSALRVGLGWDVEAGRMTDLDATCVAVDRCGNVIIDDTVYYGNLTNSNRSVVHSGDEREGDENLGGTGDDEVITVDVARLPHRVLALHFMVMVATQGKTLSDIKTALVRVTHAGNGTAICRFVPAMAGDHTALFLMRLARKPENNAEWALSIIEDTDATARDFGTLIPEIKGYTRDLVPGIEIDPRERIAVMRKGGTIRLKDYSPPSQVPTAVTLGLAWDVTNGVNIDLDASAICLDASKNLVDIVYFKHLTSKDGSIRHGGDEREGDEIGDDEKIFVDLTQVSQSVKYIGFVVNSYSGQELDDVARASCHLFDSRTGRDLAQYALSNCKELDKHTALVMACLYRDDDGAWLLRIISEAAQGRVAKHNVYDLQAFLLANPSQAPSIPPEPEIILTAMPEPVPMDEEIAVNMEPLPIHQMAKLSV
uniref:C2 domain-containing protein n=1 Tax=Odontella aurita TaxID=265563 RepID=A0A7S4M701_9STRA|mmetsp:Transcript_12512/g.36932  ORF Transcript_12512/g.36932 Transcript_12512/m.36932 type:complete len:594 (+) Transcript_12512:260-2041(+)